MACVTAAADCGTDVSQGWTREGCLGVEEADPAWE